VNLLFLCVANSARSQIAEGLARHMVPPHWTVQSAGSVPTQVRSQAVAVMAEAGIDIAQQWSKSTDDIGPDTVDCVITLCAEEACPVALQGSERLHWPIPDPVGQGLPEGADKLAGFREARQQIEVRLRAFLQAQV
jgi:protein-tyrosine-phosphatase